MEISRQSGRTARHVEASAFVEACAHGCHAVQLHDDPLSLAEVVADFIHPALVAGDPALVVVSRGHREAFVSALARRGPDVTLALVDDRLRVLDAESALDAIVRDGRVDRAAFLAAFAPIVAALAARSRSPLRIYGDVVDVLRRAGRADEAIELEGLWNELGERHRMALLCGYACDDAERSSAWIDRVLDTHTHATPRLSSAESSTGEWDAAMLQSITSAEAQAPRVSAHLVCVVGEQVGQSFAVTPAAAVIGRAADAGIRVSGEGVSRQHARIRGGDGRFWIEDLGAVNGTWVNGERIERAQLSPGDRVQLGRIVLVFLTRDDATAAAVRLQRLEAASQLAGGLAHDFRNVLTVILAGIDAVADWASAHRPPDDIVEAISDIRVAAKDGAGLTQRLLDFTARDPSGLPHPVAVSKILDELASIVRRCAGRAVKVVFGPSGAAEVAVDPRALHQVLINLCNNARDAMPDGGTLTVDSDVVTLDAATARRIGLCEGAEYARILVTDTGSGMAPAVLARIFEPFFTTKPAGKGTGLGLSTSARIIREYGGRLDATSTPGEGTTFRILLPALARPAGAA